MSDVEELARRRATVGSLQGLFWLVRAITDISPRQAKKLLEAIPAQVLADMATQSNFGSVRGILSYLQELDYPTSQLETFVESMDMEKLAERAETQSFQALSWLVRKVTDISPRQAKKLLEAIPAQVLADRATQSDFGSVRGILSCLQELDYPTGQLREYVESMDISRLAQRSKVESLQNLYWLVRELQPISSVTANDLLEIITPSGLAALCLSQGATVNALNDFLKVSTKRFRRRFLQQLTAKDIAAILDRSPLGHVGSLIQYRYRQCEEGYTLFKERYLAKKLSTEPLAEIGKFVHRVHQARGVGEHLAREALDLLVVTDLSERITSTDLEHFALLLYNANDVGNEYPSRLLEPLGQPKILRAAVENSGIRGIELLIFNVASIDERYLRNIRQALKALDLVDKLATAEVADLGHFLWNVFAYVDEDLSREYCAILDRQPRSVRLRKAPLDALSIFLWNLTHISNLQRLQTLADPTLKVRLVSTWVSEVGQVANLLGIIATTQPDICEKVQLGPIDMQVQEKNLADWLIQAVEGQSPYVLALTLRGLRVYDELQTQAVVRKSLPIMDARKLLENAIASAVTPRSVALLEETLLWLEEL